MLVSGFNTRAVIAAARYLTRASVEFAVVDRGPRDLIRGTAYARRGGVRLSERPDVAETHEALDKLRSQYPGRRLVVLPFSEYFIRFWLSHRASLEACGRVTLAVPTADLYYRIANKSPFLELCRAAGLAVPSRVAVAQAEVPIVAKPRTEFTADGRRTKPQLLLTKRRLREFLAEWSSEDYFLQEFIGGPSYYLLFYFFKSGDYWLAAQTNGRQQDNGGSICFAWSCQLPDERTASCLVRLFRAQEYRGFVMVEVRVGDGRHCIIEANPRLWGPSQLMNDAGVHFLEAWLADETGQDAPQLFWQPNVPYLWARGALTRRCVWLPGGRRRFWELFPAVLRHDVLLRRDSYRAFLRDLIGTRLG